MRGRVLMEFGDKGSKEFWGAIKDVDPGDGDFADAMLKASEEIIRAWEFRGRPIK